MSTHAARFCPNCGAQRNAGARFCGNCGEAFTDESLPTISRGRAPLSHPPALPPPLPQAAAAIPIASKWKVATGDQLPLASQLFDLSVPRVRTAAPPANATQPASPQGKSLWGSAFWMSLTQGADMITREMTSGAPNDPRLPLRLGVAAAVAVFSVTMGSMPRLRSILVRLGTLAMGVLQGQAILPLVQHAILDPSLLKDLAPNLGAHAVGLMALFQLFRAASSRPA